MNSKEAKEHISKIEKECNEEIRSSRRQNARSLVKRLLGDPAHLFPEMLQNTDDAQATVLKIDINKRRIIFQNNGKKFNEQEIDKICSIGLSTKKTLEYIGMYGIGFKSVFAVSKRPEIYTGNYSFCFDDETVFVPTWISPKPELSRWNTTIILPLEDEQAYSALVEQITNLENDNAKSMIFLKNLKEIRVKSGDTENVFEKTEMAPTDLKEIGNRFEFVEIEKNGKSAISFCVYTLREKIPSDLLKHLIQERQLVGVDDKEEPKIHLNISFEIDSDRHITPSQNGLLYAFLPMKVKTSLAFDINADFLLNPNRETLNRINDQYNCWLIELAVRALKDIVRTYKEKAPEQFWPDIYELLPLEETGEKWIEDEICEQIKEFFREGDFFLTDHPKKPWVSHNEIVETSSEIRELFPLFSEIDSIDGKSKFYYLSTKIKHELRDSLVKEFDLRRVGVEYLLEVFSKAVLLTNKTDDWFFRLFVLLGEKCAEKHDWSHDDYLRKVKKCYLIPCSNGQVVRLTENKVYRSTENLPEFIVSKALKLQSGLYDKLTEKNDSDWQWKWKRSNAKKFIFDLIEEANPIRIYEDIIRPEFANVGDEEIDEGHCRLLDKYIIFLKSNDVKSEGVKIRINGQRVYRIASSLYLSNDYLKDENAGLFYDIEKLVGECNDALFVTQDYLSLDENQGSRDTRGWRDFLILLGVKAYTEIEERFLFTAKSKEDFIGKYKEKVCRSAEFQLSGTGKPYTGRSYGYNMRNIAYKLKDFFFKEPFASILNKKLEEKNAEFFEQLLKMLDLNWKQIRPKARFHYLYTYMSTGYSTRQEIGEDTTPDFSSFDKWLQEKEWLPTKTLPKQKTKLVKPSEAYLFSAETVGVKDASYLEQDLVKNEELRRILRLRTTKVTSPIAFQEDINSLLQLYRKWQKEELPLDRYKEELLGRLYRQMSEKIESEVKEGKDDTWIKFKNNIEMVYSTLESWRRLNDIFYYFPDRAILERLNDEIRREVLLVPYNTSSNDIRFLLDKLNIKDLSSELSTVLSDGIIYEELENDYFVDLANALVNFWEEDKQEKEIREKCESITRIPCHRAISYVEYALKRHGTIVSKWMKTDGVLVNGIFWYSGELSELGVEMAKELCTKFGFDKEARDFIEKVFARSEQYTKKVLGVTGGDYKILFQKKEKEGKPEGGKIPPGEGGGKPGGKIRTGGGYGSGGEGDDHKKLKEWVAQNPTRIGITNVKKTKIEYRFASEDIADIVFELDGGSYIVVEIETFNPYPGCHQALKYRVLKCAELGLDIKSSNVEALLVAWTIPEEVKKFCNKYGISFVEKKL